MVTVDAIYEARNLKYISSINLTTSTIKYSLTRSKTIIDIDNHIISFSSYIKFINWLESLIIKQSFFSKSLLFLAFNNEQNRQKNYLYREYNIIVFHIVTNFIVFHHD